jgi:hypothetical protein
MGSRASTIGRVPLRQPAESFRPLSIRATGSLRCVGGDGELRNAKRLRLDLSRGTLVDQPSPECRSKESLPGEAVRGKLARGRPIVSPRCYNKVLRKDTCPARLMQFSLAEGRTRLLSPVAVEGATSRASRTYSVCKTQLLLPRISPSGLTALPPTFITHVPTTPIRTDSARNRSA